MNSYVEPLAEMFTRSKLMILDFDKINSVLPAKENIKLYFENSIKDAINPRLPANRQRFNNEMLKATGTRYLVSQYGEDRSAMLAGSSIAREGRVLHMGIDIFSEDQETVYAPCDGEIVQCGQEPENHSFGYFIILKPSNNDNYIFLGHLSSELPQLGPVKAGQPIAKLGDFNNNENGGWSRHLHLQLCSRLPEEGKAPLGYSSKANYKENQILYPDPTQLFPNWNIL